MYINRIRCIINTTTWTTWINHCTSVERSSVCDYDCFFFRVILSDEIENHYFLTLSLFNLYALKRKSEVKFYALTQSVILLPDLWILVECEFHCANFTLYSIFCNMLLIKIVINHTQIQSKFMPNTHPTCFWYKKVMSRVCFLLKIILHYTVFKYCLNLIFVSIFITELLWIMNRNSKPQYSYLQFSLKFKHNPQYKKYNNWKQKYIQNVIIVASFSHPQNSGYRWWQWTARSFKIFIL